MTVRSPACAIREPMTDPVADFLHLAVVPMDASHVSGTLDAAESIRTAHPDLTERSIHAAAALGDDAAIRSFIEHDALTATAKGGPYGWDPLTCLCFSRYLRIDRSRADAFVRTAKALLDAGADPNTGFLSSEEPRPVWESAIYGAAGVAHCAPLTRLLLARGANPNDEETAYHAAEWFDMACVQALVESGALEAEGVTTLLHRKLDWTHFEGAEWLLQHGADPNALSLWGRRALHHSIQRDNLLPFIELLLQHGADPALDDANGRSAVLWAAGMGRADVLSLFAQRGFDVELQGAAGLLAACARGDAAAVRVLVADNPGLVPEIQAAYPAVLAHFAGAGNTDGVALMLDLGFSMTAATDLPQSPGAFPLHLAIWRARADTVRLLIERGTPLELRDRAGRTPLALAAQAQVEHSEWTPHESTELLEILLEAGADPAAVSLPTGAERVDALLRRACG